MSSLLRSLLLKRRFNSIVLKQLSGYNTRQDSGQNVLGYDKVEPVLEKDYRNVFESTLPHVINAVIHEEDPRLESVMQRLKEILEYNIPLGKKIRGITAVMTYETLTKSQQKPKEEMYLIHLMGWCIEIMHSYFIVEDDIMDQSLTRRGRQCWFRKENVGLAAINDGILLESAMFKILKKYFRNYPYYLSVMELFHEAILKTSFGQSLDTMVGKLRPIDLQRYTVEYYATITEYKTSYYTFYLPVAVALHMCGIADPNIHAQAKDILFQIGHYFQAQDDFLDCFGNPLKTGKIASDIREGKCTWLITAALEKADDEQRKLLECNYGHENPDCEARVVNIYRDLKLPELYEDYEEQTHRHITSLINRPNLQLPSNIFTYSLKQIYKRTS